MSIDTIEEIKFDERGLVPVIVQDYATAEVLMFAWMNRESYRKTLETGIMTYWSRSRRKLWVKGETSGNVQEIREIFFDCDADCILCKVEQKGLGAACHTGYKSCFHRKVNREDGSLTIQGERLFDPDEVYG